MKKYYKFIMVMALIFVCSFALQAAEVKGKQSQKVDNLIIHAQSMSNLDSAMYYFDKAEKVAKGNKVEMAKIFNHKGNYSFNMNDYAKSMESYRKELKIYLHSNDSLSQAHCLSNIASCFEMGSNFDSAMVHCHAALNLLDEKEFNARLNKKKLKKQDSVYILKYAEVYKEYYFIQEKLQQYDKAYEAFQIYYSGYEKVAKQEELVGLYVNAANINRNSGENDVALSYYLKAEQLSIKLNYKEVLPVIYANLSGEYFEMKNYVLSKKYAEKSFEIYPEIYGKNKNIYYYKNLLFLGKAELFLGNTPKSIKLFKEVLAHSKDAQQVLVELYAYQYLMIAHAAQGSRASLDSAQFYLNKLDTIETKYYEEISSDKIAQYEVELDVAKAKQAAADLLSINKTQERKSILLIALILIAIAVIILFYWQHRQKQANIKLLSDKNAKLMELSTMKDSFISLLAHDIKNPLAHTISSVSLLIDFAKEMTEEQRRETLDSISLSSKNLLRLLEDILEWLRASKHTLKIDKQAMTLENLIDSKIDVFTGVANKKGITLEKHIPEDLNVFADIPIITTVVRNLLQNAIKFTPSGGKIIISAVAIDAKKARISITDTGVGMSSDVQDTLFKMDKLQSMPGTDGEQGTGMGLVMCKEYLVKHGTDLTIVSEENKGTSVSFMIDILNIANEPNIKEKN